MKKIKKLVALLAATILSLGVCAFAACGDNDNNDNNDNNNTEQSGDTNTGDTNTGDTNTDDTDGDEEVVDDKYVIYVKDTDGNPIVGVRIGICGYNKELGEKTDKCTMPQITDANGKVEFGGETVPEDSYALNTDFETFETYQVNKIYITVDNNKNEVSIFEDYGVYTVILEEAAN